MSRPLRLFFVGYDQHASMRLRMLQHVPALERDGYVASVCLLRQGDRYAALKALPRLSAELRRADVVVVQRVLARSLNQLLRASRVPVVFDLDDALHYVRPAQQRVSTDLRARLKPAYRRVVRGDRHYSSRRRLLKDMTSLARVMITANDWLRTEILPRAHHVVVMPTPVELQPDRVKIASDTRPVRIGWIGHPDNFIYLRSIEDAFAQLSSQYRDEVVLTVVARSPFKTDAIATEFIEWSPETERSSVLNFDIGVVPLFDDPFSLGKCSFKAILCMSHAIPVVLSPVSTNNALVRHGWNGFHAMSTDQWHRHISSLVDDVQLRQTLGTRGYHTIRDGYTTKQSLETLRAVFASIG
jgi:glycosyltransferase involved in cell wall biosynthesis